jgi:hypothetical protein
MTDTVEQAGAAYLLDTGFIGRARAFDTSQ